MGVVNGCRKNGKGEWKDSTSLWGIVKSFIDAVKRLSKV